MVMGRLLVLAPIVCVLTMSAATAQVPQSGKTYRLYDGITAYVNNPGDKPRRLG